MPYNNRYRKKRYRKRPSSGGYLRTAGNVMQVAQTALTTAYAVKRLINVEFKNKFSQITATAIPTTAIRTTLFSLAQGDTNITRDGNQVRWKSIYLKYFLTQNVSASNTQVRVILVYDGKSTGTQPTLSQILQDSTVSDNLISPVNFNLTKRFVFLYDRMHTLSTGGPSTESGKFYKKIDMKCQYNGSAGTIADLDDKNIELVFIGSEATNTPIVTSMVQLRFIDN